MGHPKGDGPSVTRPGPAIFAYLNEKLEESLEEPMGRHRLDQSRMCGCRIGAGSSNVCRREWMEGCSGRVSARGMLLGCSDGLGCWLLAL